MAKKKTKQTKTALKSADVPVTLAMLSQSEQRILNRMDERFHGVDAKFSSMDAKFSSMDAKFSSMDAKFSSMDAKISGIKSELHRVALLVEEQNSRNKYVMDGYTQIYELLMARG